MKRSNLIALGVIMGILVCASIFTYVVYRTPNDKANSEAQMNLAVSEEKPYTDLEGNPIDFSSFAGKVRVVNSWASWNPFSAQELKDLEMLAKENSDIAVIAINRKEPKEQAVRFLGTLGAFDHIVFAIDLTDSFYSSIGGYAMPETIVYDARGAIVLHKRGELTLEEMRSVVAKAKSGGE